ncbi:hypothetical protein STRDD11_01090 [Streptococcus sp. DD11]|nr:hypothetical protein STRDD11_01090 [Streptococcus sp. DD11]
MNILPEFFRKSKRKMKKILKRGFSGNFPTSVRNPVTVLHFSTKATA